MTPRDRLTVLTAELTEVQRGNLKNEDEILKIMFQKRIEKLPIVDSKNLIIGLVTRKDIERNKTL